MENYLYQDLYALEDKHWWHKAKRQLVVEALQRFLPKPSSPTAAKTHSKPLRILDVGCGTGKNLEVFGQFGDAYGIDISPQALKFCKKRGLAHVQLGDVEKKLPYRANTFDVITLLDVLEHIEESTLQEVYRILKPNGLLIITVPAFLWLWSDWDVVLHHKRRYTTEHLNKVIRKYRFKPLFSSYVYTFLALPAYVIRLLKSRLPKKTTQSYESDFRLNSPYINTMCEWVATVDRWLMWRMHRPFGTSVFLAAQKGKHG